MTDGDEPADFPRASCAACVHVYVPDKGTPWYRWLCVACPAPTAWNPVTGKIQAEPPWRRCAEVNRDGRCGLFRGGINMLNSPHRERPDE